MHSSSCERRVFVFAEALYCDELRFGYLPAVSLENSDATNTLNTLVLSAIERKTKPDAVPGPLFHDGESTTFT
jgi:hypothetical protein